MSDLSSSPRFVHLAVHSEFSLIDSTLSVKQLCQLAASDGQVAVALTDWHNMFGLVQFYKAALVAGVKPIAGADMQVQQVDGSLCAVTFLCLHYDGYQNLSYLMSRAYTEGQKTGEPVIQWSWLQSHHEGLLVMLGQDSMLGKTALTQGLAEATPVLLEWTDLMPQRVLLSVSRTGRMMEAQWIGLAVALSTQSGVPMVAVNHVCFATPEDFEAHEVRVCIREGYVLDDSSRPKRHSEQQYWRSQDEMCELFADMPQVLANTVAVAQACNLSLSLGKNYLPDFPIPDGMTIDEYFAYTSRKGLDERLAIQFDTQAPDFGDKAKPYRERLEIELSTINQMGFPGYFLIVADFIQWAKDNGIPVGPGRGSGAGSLVAYALKITDLDPLPYDLLFERFLNPERVSMPDFDVDFCMDRRDEVIDYVARTYGRDHVSQIITYGTMAAKGVIRDVGRVLGFAYGFVDRISKLIPNELGITLKDAIEKEPELKDKFENDEEVAYLLRLGLKLEGLARNVGRHAGGVVIGPRPLWTFAPMFCEADGSNLVTQFDKSDVEAVGLVKFDFLGLRTLTIIDWALKGINQGSLPAVMRETGNARADGPIVDISRIPLDDAKTYTMIKTGNTSGVFQLESSGMQDLIRRLQPDCFEDIVALVALFRPGPLGSGMVDDFINRKHGRQKVEYLHPCLEPILKPTYGTILYQEQVMQTAQIMANYSLGGADLLRRAMGKKDAAEMARQRETFRVGAEANGIDPEIAGRTFDIMEEFANYGFNKSHSAAYALVSYQTAWLKTHYPAYLMAAVLTADMDNTDKVVHMLKECRSMGLTVLPPAINQSSVGFSVQTVNAIRYGLGAVKGAGEDALAEVMKERSNNGMFKDLFDFCVRTNKQLNRRMIEALIDAGAMDELGTHRAALHANLTKALDHAQQEAARIASGQNDLFGDAFAMEDVVATCEYDVCDETPLDELLRKEKAVLGFFLSGHPFDAVRDRAKRFAHTLASLPEPKAADFGKRGGQKVLLAGRIDAIRTKIGKRGDRMVFVAIEDQDQVLEVSVFGDLGGEVLNKLAVDDLVVVDGELSLDGYSGQARLRASRIIPFEQAYIEQAKAVMLTLHASGDWDAQGLLQLLASARDDEQGKPVRFVWRQAGWQVPLTQQGNAELLSLLPTPEWMSALARLGIEAELLY
ncbi:MAG: DNA polymerase III subunit alpha [Gammaproteobacteria bacterium]|nr:DNA polymerase III subunit alpha [Gammaproteobacteria bacterium]